MPLKKIEKTGFIYIVYCRSGIEDYLELKYVLKNSQIDPEQRDIVVDVTRNALLNENEIGLLANTVNSLRGTKRFLRIISGKTICQKLTQTNLFKSGNMAAYDSHEALLENLNTKPPKGGEN